MTFIPCLVTSVLGAAAIMATAPLVLHVQIRAERRRARRALGVYAFWLGE